MNYIFILDLDGTVIGNCIFQCEIYNIENILKKNAIKCNYSNLLNKAYHEKSKLLRPYFLYFYNTIKSKFPNSYFYVYTASDKKWALKEINIIEKQNNIKFNRPIFTRNNCILASDGTYKKSIKKILKKKINNSQIIVIDNNSVYIDFTDNLIICPTYNYKFFHNLWDLFPSNCINNKNIQFYIERLIKNNILCPFNNNSINIKYKTEAYKWLYNICLNIKNDNKHINDDFWKKITDYIVNNNITSFNKNSIKSIKSNLLLS